MFSIYRNSLPNVLLFLFATVYNVESSPKCTPKKLNIVFVIDGSGSIGSNNFKLMSHFLGNLTRKFSDNIKVAAIQFGCDYQVEFNFDGVNNNQVAANHFDTMTYMSGSCTNAGKALYGAKTLLSNPSKQSNAVDVVIVLTDGQSGDNPEPPAKELRKDGVATFAVGVGNSVDNKQILTIAGEKDSVFKLADFHAFDTKFNDSFTDKLDCIEPQCNKTENIPALINYYQNKIKKVEEKISDTEDEKQELRGLDELIKFMTIDPNDYNDAKWNQIEANVQGLLTESNTRKVGTDLIEMLPVQEALDLLNLWGEEYKVPQEQIDLIKIKLKSDESKSEVIRSAFNEGEHEIAVGKITFHKRIDSKTVDIGIATEYFNFQLPLKKVEVENGFNERCSRFLKYSEDKWCNSTRWVKFKYSNPKLETNKEADLIDWMEHKLALRYKRLYSHVIGYNNSSMEALDKKIKRRNDSKARDVKMLDFLIKLLYGGKQLPCELVKGIIAPTLYKK